MKTPEEMVQGVLALYRTPHIADHWHVDAARLLTAWRDECVAYERKQWNATQPEFRVVNESHIANINAALQEMHDTDKIIIAASDDANRRLTSQFGCCRAALEKIAGNILDWATDAISERDLIHKIGAEADRALLRTRGY